MKWKALILGGGGPVGEFQIGALQVISKYYDSFDMYIGIGCGSLNSGVLAQYDTVSEGYAALLNIWNDIKRTSDIFDVPFGGGAIAALSSLISGSGWAKDSIYGNKKLTETIRKYIDWNKIKDKKNWAIEVSTLNDGQVYVVTNNKPLLDKDSNPLRTVQFSLEPGSPYNIGDHIYELLTAGGCTPLMLPPVDLFGLRFVEGGIRSCTPLELAVKAFELAKADGYDEAEFIVIDNYVHEPNFEDFQLLDSGLEIIGRTLKMMTIQIAQADIYRGQVRLEKLGVPSNVILIQPTKDFRLSPFNFNDLATRLAIRNHGVTRATLLIPQHPAVQLTEMALTLDKKLPFENLLATFNTDQEVPDHSDQLVHSILADPTLNETHFQTNPANKAMPLAIFTEAVDDQQIAYPKI
ncbi:patatin-like phospholipase family protein [Mucilaginibacter sp. UYCu711]|uniref:patatin-like phospholipase family protein n=1 Tax=Mucilaginibacter sp. UYCu711 TaxID=3156339 RepID=UPI003D23F197